LLTELGVEGRTHAGTISKFGEYVIKTKLMEKQYGRLLNQAFNLRDKSDYQVTAVIDEGEVREIVGKLEYFIDEVERLIKKREQSKV
jgi:uncharacterized protein (UPF0332 family)